MKKLLILIGAFIIIIPFVLFTQDFTYVGVGKCKICHKSDKRGRQFPIWEESKHSKSFMALNSEKALEAAKKLGLETPPAENEKCLKCHSPLHEKAPEFKEEGVACEVCHGPGSAYKKLTIMKSRDESVKNGLIVYDSPESMKKQCLTCHEMAHDKPFDFDASWEKIKHPVPEKE